MSDLPCKSFCVNWQCRGVATAGGKACVGETRFVPASQLEAELGGGKWMEGLLMSKKVAYGISF